jgi:hypothetical protein
MSVALVTKVPIEKFLARTSKKKALAQRTKLPVREGQLFSGGRDCGVNWRTQFIALHSNFVRSKSQLMIFDFSEKSSIG